MQKLCPKNVCSFPWSTDTQACFAFFYSNISFCLIKVRHTTAQMQFDEWCEKNLRGGPNADAALPAGHSVVIQVWLNVNFNLYVQLCRNCSIHQTLAIWMKMFFWYNIRIIHSKTLFRAGFTTVVTNCRIELTLMTIGDVPSEDSCICGLWNSLRSSGAKSRKLPT